MKKSRYKKCLTTTEIRVFINEISKNFSRIHGSESNKIIVPILTGSLFFSADLCRVLSEKYNDSHEIIPIISSSYSDNSRNSISKYYLDNLRDIKDKSRLLVLVDEICDSGNTFLNLIDLLKSIGFSNIVTISLLKRHTSSFTPDFVGATIYSSEFLVGYGLDDKGYKRSYKDIYILRKEE